MDLVLLGRVLCGCVLLLAAAAAGAPPKDGAYAVIAGTVFRENGFSLAGAAVTLSSKDEAKIIKMQSVSDSRGEFAFRVAAKPGAYIIKASLKGFQPAEKQVSVVGAERVEVTLALSSESKR
jgi:hypothetical protein